MSSMQRELIKEAVPTVIVPKGITITSSKTTLIPLLRMGRTTTRIITTVMITWTMMMMHIHHASTVLIMTSIMKVITVLFTTHSGTTAPGWTHIGAIPRGMPVWILA